MVLSCYTPHIPTSHSWQGYGDYRIIARLEFELAYFMAADKNISHKAT